MSVQTKSWLTEKQIAEYYDVFLSFDEDGDKALTVGQLSELLQYIGEYNNFNGQEILKDIDSNDNGLVEFEEFLFLLQLQSSDRNQLVSQAFTVLDPTGKGVITAETLQQACANLGVKMSADEIKDMVAEADPEGKGTVDFQELKTMIQETDDSVPDLTARPGGSRSDRLKSIEEESEHSESEKSSNTKARRRRRKRKSKSKNRKKSQRRKKLYRLLWIYTLNAVVRKIHGNMDMYRGNGDTSKTSMFPAIPQKRISAKPTSLPPTRRSSGTSYRNLMTEGRLSAPCKTYVSYINKRPEMDSPRYSMYYLSPIKKHTNSESVAWFNAPIRSSRSNPEYSGMRRTTKY